MEVDVCIIIIWLVLKASVKFPEFPPIHYIKSDMHNIQDLQQTPDKLTILTQMVTLVACAPLIIISP